MYDNKLIGWLVAVLVSGSVGLLWLVEVVEEFSN